MSQTITFAVAFLPPKKDGAQSMWGKPSEVGRIKLLRLKAFQAMEGRSLASKWVHMNVRLYADPSDGDLDNFITGVCDGLMAARKKTNEMDWADVPMPAKPSNHIVFSNDALVSRVTAERFPPDAGGKRYEITLEFE
jgi:hypothetical protein